MQGLIPPVQEFITLSLVQASAITFDVTANLSHLEELLASQVSAESDLIILPEMFNTGFHVIPEKYAENWGLTTTRWLSQQAKNLQKPICGTFAVKENGQYFNRFVWINPNGTFQTYNKHHLFSLGKENIAYAAGISKIRIELKGWQIMPVICFEIRFPEWCRNTKTNNYDILLVCANWPEERIAAWDTLIAARAIENSAYTVAVNRFGSAEESVFYPGHSQIIDPKGKKYIEPSAQKEGVFEHQLSYSALHDYKTKFPFHNEWKHTAF